MEKRSRKEVKNHKENFDGSGDDDDEVCFLFGKRQGTLAVFLCIAVFGLLVRVAVSLHSYSGAGTPPKFGDFEAQRHWMEITLNLSVKEWYRNSTTNDLSYWGLDYPPLTAYQSYVHGLFLRYFAPNSVALISSRGHETYLGKLLMRWTVLSSDALVFFPAVFYFVFVYYVSRSCDCKSEVAWHMAVILINPCLILIDHGHFQYNCISLGLAVGAIAAVLSGKDLVASVLFCLSLNHKQMSTYFAPAFFSHLLGKCLRRKNPLFEVSKLGVVVLGTFAVVWWPYLHPKDAILRVLSRLTPFERGIYEDYVANFWCTSSIVVKWKRIFPTSLLRLISLVATVLACLPSMIQQILYPSSKGFLYALLNSSFAFYMFSFQVHEKSILLPLLPATLLAVELGHPFMLLMHYALFSMFPLLRRDKLIASYFTLSALFMFLYFAPFGIRESKKHRYTIPAPVSVLMNVLYLCSLVLHILYLIIDPPERYPYIFEAMIMLICFAHFFLFAFYTNVKQWMLSRQIIVRGKEKKLN